MLYVYITVYFLALISEFLLVPKFLEYSWPEKCLKSLKVKMVCAAMFLIAAICCMLYAQNYYTYATNILLGLLFGALGDLLIHIVAKKPTVNILGGVAFLIGHIFYIIAFMGALRGIKPEAKFICLPTIIVPVVFVAIYFIFITVKKVKIGALTIPVIIYALTIITMLTTAARFAIASMKPSVFITVLLGAVCFVMSDATLALFTFSKQFRKKGIKTFYIVTYFTAQFLLATSIIYIY